MPAPAPARSARRPAAIDAALGPLQRASRHLLGARFGAAEDALIDALTSGALDHYEGRAFAHANTGLLALFGRNDARAALAASTAFLAEVQAAAAHGEAQSLEVLARGHALAALVHGTPDGRLFAPARVATLAAQTRAFAPDDDTDSRALAALAEAWCAFHQGHRRDFQSFLERRHADLAAASTPVPRMLREHLQALSSALDGFQPDACRRLEALADDARSIGFAVGECRALARHAMASNIAGAPREALLAIADRYDEAQGRGRLQAGFSDLLLGAARAEALHGLGRFADVDDEVTRVTSLAAQLRWPAADLLLVQTRFTFHANGVDAVAALARDFETSWSPLGRPSIDACIRYLHALDAQMHGDADRSAQLFAEAHDLARATGVRPWLEHMSVGLELASRTALTPVDSAEAALRRFDRSLEGTPSPWFSALRNHFVGILRSHQGRSEQAREALEAAVATWTLCGEVTETARARRSFAVVATVLGDPDADALFDASDKELAAMGIPVADAQTRERAQALAAQRRRDPTNAPAATFSPLAVGLRRLAVRGLTPHALLSELASLTTQATGERPTVGEAAGDRLLPLAGESTPSTWPAPESFEFGDGCGRRFALGFGRELSADVRARVQILVTAASLALEVNALRATVDPKADTTVSPAGEVEGFIVASDAMRAVVRDVQRLGRSRATVLIHGESGTGKEAIARAVHDASSRSDQAYVTFNCTAVPSGLFEGQLFGYRKGAFTGSTRNHPGVIRAADAGTLFLDEVGELPLDVQAKLLRFLENREVQPLGETRPVRVDVRVVAATHRDLEAMVKAGTFREDLLFRLQVVPLRLPPLRDRPDDILPLAQHFVARFAPEDGPLPRLAPETVMALMQHPWPGNVRELRNVMERSLAFSPAPTVLVPSDLRLSMRD